MEQVPPADRVLTVPNLLSAIRLALIPVFVYVLLFAHANGWAVAILMFSGASDWADGKIARTLNQSSRLGVLLDPAVDRLYMVTVPAAKRRPRHPPARRPHRGVKARAERTVAGQAGARATRAP